MKKLFLVLCLILTFLSIDVFGGVVRNPVLPGFNPDPSVCRVGDDYYLATSSFMFYPGIPVYHSRNLADWELIGHAINENNIDKFHFEGLGDNDGVWAPAIRYHDGKFYIVSTVWRGGGNFVLTADNPAGPWSDPVWIPEAKGIDPTLFWDEDGKVYYVGNRYDFKGAWPGQVGIQIQEIDLGRIVADTVRDDRTGLRFVAPTCRLVGENHLVSFGHAANATYAEGPHLYKIDGSYLLLMAEGGSGRFHAVTAHWADSVFGPYSPQHINPVLTHRHLGSDYPVQNIGHADLVQTPDGDWFAVCLGNRHIPVAGSRGTACPLGRETWLVKAEFRNGQLLMSPGCGLVPDSIAVPDVPSVSADRSTQIYIPMTMRNLRLEKVTSHEWNFSRRVSDDSEDCGIVLFRTVNSYYALLKDGRSVFLRKVAGGEESTVAEIPVTDSSAELSVEAKGMRLRFFCNGVQLGEDQSYLPLCDDGRFNKFNGTGVGYILR